MGKRKIAWFLSKSLVILWLLLGSLITTAANAAVVFRDGIAEKIIGEHVTVMRYDPNGQLDYRLEAKQELRSLKITQSMLLNIETARLERLQYIDGVFIKALLKLTFETAKNGAGQIKLFNVTGQLNGQRIKAKEVTYHMGKNDITFINVRYFNNYGFSQKQHVRYVISDINSTTPSPSNTDFTKINIKTI